MSEALPDEATLEISNGDILFSITERSRKSGRMRIGKFVYQAKGKAWYSPELDLTLTLKGSPEKVYSFYQNVDGVWFRSGEDRSRLSKRIELSGSFRDVKGRRRGWSLENVVAVLKGEFVEPSEDPTLTADQKRLGTAYIHFSQKTLRTWEKRLNQMDRDGVRMAMVEIAKEIVERRELRLYYGLNSSRRKEIHSVLVAVFRAGERGLLEFSPTPPDYLSGLNFDVSSSTTVNETINQIATRLHSRMYLATRSLETLDQKLLSLKPYFSDLSESCLAVYMLGRVSRGLGHEPIEHSKKEGADK